MLRFRASLRGSDDALGQDAAWSVRVVRDGFERITIPLSSSSGSGDSARPQELTDLAFPLWGVVNADTTLEFRVVYEDSAPGERDVELPAAVLGALVFDYATNTVLINRVPGPGQRNVAVGGPGSYAQDFGISFEVYVPLGVAAPTPPLAGDDASLWINGILAWTSAGGDAPGFTTTNTPYDLDNTSRFTVVLDDPLPQGSEVVVRLRVDYGAGGTLDESWSFFTEDLAAPELTSARPLSLFTVRGVWNEDVRAVDPASASDALNPANWSLELLSTSLADGLPAVLPSAVSVTRVDGRTFDVVFDRELTRRARYALVAQNVVDLAYEANPVAPPDTRAEFVGFAPQQPALRRFLMLDWLPRMNVAEDETGDLRKFVACLQEVADLLLADVDRFAEIFDSDLAPERYLDAVLQGLGNPFRFALDEVDKRRLARLLVPIYQLKGTDRGIVDAVRFFVGVEVEVVLLPVGPAWNLGVSLCGVNTYLGGASLYDRLSFWVRCAEALTDAQRERIRAIVEYMKRAECHFRGFLEPVPEVPATPFWDLGVSLLGVDTVLGPG
jgi:phage tail-like protein